MFLNGISTVKHNEYTQLRNYLFLISLIFSFITIEPFHPFSPTSYSRKTRLPGISDFVYQSPTMKHPLLRRHSEDFIEYLLKLSPGGSWATNLSPEQYEVLCDPDIVEMLGFPLKGELYAEVNIRFGDFLDIYRLVFDCVKNGEVTLEEAHEEIRLAVVDRFLVDDVSEVTIVEFIKSLAYIRLRDDSFYSQDPVGVLTCKMDIVVLSAIQAGTVPIPNHVDSDLLWFLSVVSSLLHSRLRLLDRLDAI
ncbi:hypothetical protein BGZ63DRAFT_440319 [Mariannaea sp. PMI_226]|nr:hypothetical protein BGZ63DRAFT_440319 [Mariannaea sp. PMI_226]